MIPGLHWGINGNPRGGPMRTLSGHEERTLWRMQLENSIVL